MMEELAFCIGQERGTEFISTLVAAYSGAPVPIRDRTRTGGEIVIPPEAIMERFGDLDKGHQALDQWVVDFRKKHIQTLRGLKPPKKD